MQRPAQKSHVAPDGLAAGQAGNGLVHHRLEHRCGQVGLRRAVVDQRLNIRLGKHAAPGGNRVNFLIVRRLPVEAQGVCLHQRGHLVDKAAGAAGADAVHAFLQAAGKINDLGVLAAQLDGHVGLRRFALQRRRHRRHFLHEGHLQRLAQAHAAAAGDGAAHAKRTQLCPGFLQYFNQCFLGVGVMPPIRGKSHAAVFVQQHGFHRGRAHVHAPEKCFHQTVYSQICNFNCMRDYVP